MRKGALAISEMGKWLLFLIFLLIFIFVIYALSKKANFLSWKIFEVFRFWG